MPIDQSDIPSKFLLPSGEMWTPARFDRKYTPIIKKKGFNPTPIAGRVPTYANSALDKDVIGTPKYDEFWEEQIRRCIEGYETGGLWIPGRYYYFLNFQPIAGVKGNMFPLFCDFHLELAYAVEWVKHFKITGLIILKARRKGLSEFMKGAILNYGLTFGDTYRGAVFAGIENYVKGIKKKVMNGLTNTVDDMRLNILKNNDKELRIGYEERINGTFIESGSLNEIQMETLFNSESKLEGEYFNDVLSEESGENPRVKAAFESIKPSLMFGSEMEGTFYIYGTAGNILSGSKDFIDMYRNHVSFDLVKIFVDGTRLYYPFFITPNEHKGVKNEIGKTVDPIRNLRPLIAEHGRDCLMGCEDIEAAKENIRMLYAHYEKLQDKKNLIELKKNFPLDEEDAITSGGSNNFDNEALFSRLQELQTKVPPPGNYVLEMVTVGEGKEWKQPLEVKARLARPDDPDWKVINILQHPLKGMRNVDDMGVDSYNQDQTNTSRSLGGIVVLRDGRDIPSEINGIKIRKGIYPVVCYEKRPPKKEQFYMIALMLAIYYDLPKDVMISAEHDFLIDFFKKNGGRRYLSPRPRSFDSQNTEATYEYGSKLASPQMISRALGIAQSWVDDHIHLCDFEVLIKGLIAFDEINIGTDWDIVDALIYALMRIVDRKAKPRSEKDDLKEENSQNWTEDRDGNVVSKTGNSTDEGDYVMMGDKKMLV